MTTMVLNAIAIGSIAAGVVFGGYMLDAHLNDYAKHEADFQCVRCVTECHEFCAANGIIPTDCDCVHCRRYCGGVSE